MNPAHEMKTFPHKLTLAPLLLLGFLLLALPAISAAQPSPQPTVGYAISLSNPAEHRLRITMSLPPGAAEHELQLPVWNALYQVRDFSQNMNWIRATKQDQSSGPIVLTQLNPSRWKLTGADRGARVEYDIFADSPGSFGAQFTPHHAFLNLAQILLYADDTRNQPAQIGFRNLPAHWKIATPLAQSGD